MGATQLAKRFKAKDGIPVSVRLLRQKDAAHLVDLFEHMGPESRYRRFHQPMDDVTPDQVWDEAEKIATAVPEEQLGLIAFSELPGEGEVAVGVARIVWLSDSVAEVAMSVRDDRQAQGIGKRLLAMVLELAQITGAESVVGLVQNDNEPMWHLFEQLPYPLKRTIDGAESEIELDLLKEKEEVGVETAV
ncbi:MAG: GNAT family N-acetyltransferase [Ardenticatenaceae bacterium]|nr:GNAT family N-acetyltransferase [Anaerolineales bacterium]MCB8941122.1 GNAT family N-acetyltransferase [Ardenticatenaceae bacterium]MCB8972463.1 GNAT family N-acetyltransferase [Ardenticatenaceae bacterium]